MTSPRLDRLSALLEGLAPRIEVAGLPGKAHSGEHKDASPSLRIELIAIGQGKFQRSSGQYFAVEAPALIVATADSAVGKQPVDGPNCEVLSLHVFLEGPAASLLAREFIEPAVVSLDDADRSLKHAAQLIASELRDPRCGQPALLERAGDILFIGLLRHLVAHPRATDSLFNGLADPCIARALVAIHTHPEFNWTLESLADEAVLSRTAFANRFRTVMRITPGRYLARLRLAIAQQLVDAGKGLKRAAQECGYANVSALSRALARQRA